jgi:hypothetical protein
MVHTGAHTLVYSLQGAQKLYHDRADPGDAPMTLWAEPRGRGWIIIDAAGRAVEPGVVYITKRRALAGIRRRESGKINRRQGSSPETIEADRSPNRSS